MKESTHYGSDESDKSVTRVCYAHFAEYKGVRIRQCRFFDELDIIRGKIIHNHWYFLPDFLENADGSRWLKKLQIGERQFNVK